MVISKEAICTTANWHLALTVMGDHGIQRQVHDVCTVGTAVHQKVPVQLKQCLKEKKPSL